MKSAILTTCRSFTLSLAVRRLSNRFNIDIGLKSLI
jgi:hypothetical protein